MDHYVMPWRYKGEKCLAIFSWFLDEDCTLDQDPDGVNYILCIEIYNLRAHLVYKDSIVECQIINSERLRWHSIYTWGEENE